MHASKEDFLVLLTEREREKEREREREREKKDLQS